MAKSELSDGQLKAIQITERVASVFSLLGACIIILTFTCDKGFRKPINRLVFYAACGNIFTNVATIISTEGIGLPGVCQFQAFLIQWFMPADALWAFAMACNVYLTFFHKYGAQELRRLEWKYFLFCYGAPFIPAFVYFFVHTPSRGYVYGSAVLWCWVSIKWDHLRIAIFYAPVWVMILLTFVIYVLCARVIFQWRSQLMSFAQMKGAPPSATPEPDLRYNNHKNKTEQDMPHAQTTDGRVNNYGQTSYIATASVDNHSRKTSAGALSNVHTWEHPSRQPNYTTPDQGRVALHANRAAINYCRVALLFFIALCITWIPSTINRVWTLVHPEDSKFSLSLLSGLVLPLQGFWNGVIYITTSFPVFKLFCKRMVGRGAPPSTGRGVPENFGPTTLSNKMSSPRSTIRDSKQGSVLMQAVENIKYQRSNSAGHTYTESEVGLKDEEDQASRESGRSETSEGRVGKW